MKVKVKHSGICDGHHFTKGVAVELPEKVLKALGEHNYEVLEQPKEPEVKQEHKEQKK